VRYCLLIVILIQGLAAIGCQAKPVAPISPAAPIEPEVKRDEPVPAITLEEIDKSGLEKILAAKRGQLVLVDAWATWCVPCRTGFKHTVALHERYNPQGLAVISLSMDDEAAHEEALKFLTEQGARFTNLRSRLEAEEAFAQFDIEGGSLPHLKLYDRDGKLVKKFVSGDPDKVFSPEDIELAVRELIMRSGGTP
jgi:thiol-disulfide isomerase/thioredoxin